MQIYETCTTKQHICTTILNRNAQYDLAKVPLECVKSVFLLFVHKRVVVPVGVTLKPLWRYSRGVFLLKLSQNCPNKIFLKFSGALECRHRRGAVHFYLNKSSSFTTLRTISAFLPCFKPRVVTSTAWTPLREKVSEIKLFRRVLIFPASEAVIA